MSAGYFPRIDTSRASISAKCLHRQQPAAAYVLAKSLVRKKEQKYSLYLSRVSDLFFDSLLHVCEMLRFGARAKIDSANCCSSEETRTATTEPERNGGFRDRALHFLKRNFSICNLLGETTTHISLRDHRLTSLPTRYCYKYTRLARGNLCFRRIISKILLEARARIAAKYLIASETHTQVCRHYTTQIPDILYS